MKMKTNFWQQIQKDIPQGGKSMARKAGLLIGFILLTIFGAGQALAADYTITLTPTAVTKLERDGSATFSVTISSLPSGGDVVTVPYSTSDGSAHQPGDYTAASGNLVFNGSSSLSQDVTVSITDDFVKEGSETFTFGLGSVAITTTVGSTASISGASSATVTVVDDDYVVSAFSDISINEDATTATLTVTLDRAVASSPDDSVSFTYSSTDNTAVAGSDYTAVSGTLTIPPGDISGDIVIPITDDSKVECVEDFSVTLVPTSSRITFENPPDATAVVTINVDDTYEIDVSSDFSVDVADGNAVITVIVTSPIASGDTFTVDYATADGPAPAATDGSDYTGQSGTLTFTDNGSSNPQTISVPILNDGTSTGSEKFTLNLSNIVAGTPACANAITFIDSSTVVTINDHDFTITAGADQSLDEDGGSMDFTVVLNRDPVGSEVVKVDYTTVDGTATAGNDYTYTHGTLTIDAANATTGGKNITVPILDDGVKEIAKSFTLKLSQTTGSANVLITYDTAIGTIYDDDYEVSGFSDITVNENVVNAQLTVTLDRNVAAGDSVSFTYASADNSPVDNRTALAGPDYTTVTGTLNIPVGSNSGTISIPINDDSLIELAENFSVTLTSSSTNVVVSGATTPDNSAIVTIDVDEKYDVSINDVTLPEADAPMTFTVTLSPALLNDHDGLVINLDTADVTATAPADYTAVAGGSVSFATGDTTKTQVVTIKEDAIDEGAFETYNLNLTGSSIAEIVDFTTSTGAGVGTILDTDYAITPTWNQDGTVTLESPIGTSVPITSGTGVAVVNNTQAKFTVTAAFGIQSVMIDGVAPGTLGYVTTVITDDKNHTYTFESSTPQGGHTITVLFDHQIAMTATGSGTVTHTSGTSQFIHNGGPELVLADHGINEDFLIAADANYCVTDLLIDSSSVGAFDGASDNWTANTYTFSNVTDNHTLEAQFGTAEITVTIEADDGATATSDDVTIQADALWYAYAADSSYNLGTLIKSGKHGESFSLPTDAACDTQYIVIQFLAVDNWTKPNDIHIDLNNNFKDQQVEGLYDRDYHILTITADHGDVTFTDTSGNPVGSPYVGTNQYIFPADTDIRLTAVGDPSWFFHVWEVDVSGSTSPVDITMDRDKTVKAVFVQSCQDADGDNYTVDDIGGTGCATSAQIDCNDADDAIHPNGAEICGDGIDQDCSGADLACSGDDKDDDGDGYTENQGDCDDTNVNIAPGLYDDPATAANEDCYDGPKEIGLEVTCAHPSDVPVQAARKPAPPLIMFLLDDSGSMDWEFMTDENSQLFSGKYYIFPVGSSERNYYDNRLNESQRRMWLSQWSGYNRIFFNPTTEYSPWPKWEEVIGAGNVRSHEEEYTGTGSFPDSAYAADFTHADMDKPRLNTYDTSSTINAMYHPGDASSSHASYELDMDAEFVNVKLGGGQQIMVTRDSLSSGSNTHADAIGLSVHDNLELTVGGTYDSYNTPPPNPPEIIFDNSDGSDIYLEAGTWYNSGGNDDYEWENNDRYTNTSGSSASWKLNLTAAEGDKDYFAYVWVDEFSGRDNNALYTIFSYDETTGDLQSETVRIDQSPLNSSGTPPYGAHWIKLNGTAIHFVAQSATDLSIPNSHYYTWYDANNDGDYWNDIDGDGVRDANEVEDPGEKYLVIIRGSGHGATDYSLEYYLFTDVNNNNTVEDGELSLATGSAIPTAVIPVKYDVTGTKITDADELAYVVRQDFADWFSFYRRRALTAKAAVGLTVVDMWELKLGLHTINRTYSEPLVFMDETQPADKINYLTTLYNIRPKGSTYLRRGLDDVGRYFEENDSVTISGTTYTDNSNLKTSDGLNPGSCSGDVSVFYDKDKDFDTDTCDDAGGECQRAYVIAMTDGYYNDGYYSSRVGNADGSSSYPFMTDSASNSLADFSYYYYNHDLDTTLGDNVPPKGFDSESYQKLVTYMVSFGVFGYFDPKKFPDCLPSCDTPGRDGCPDLADISVKSWTESGSSAVFSGSSPYSGACPDWHNGIFQDDPKAIDDLYHASVNGRGRFYNAADPGELVQSLKSIKQLIDDVTGTAASVSVNSRKIENDTLLFQTTYDSSDWSGDVLAKCLDSTGDIASCLRASCEASCSDSYVTCANICAIGDTACEAVCGTALTNCLTTNSCSSFLTCGEDKKVCDENCAGDTTCLNTCTTTETTCSDSPPEVKWSAKEQMVAQTYDTRQIITSKLDLTGTAGVAGIPFRWSNLPVSMQTSLNNQQDMLNFLRGSTQYERRNDTAGVHNYRNRPQTVLGDFINSEPYQYSNSALGIDWVFVGGNDGMLHCFDGQTGNELFAYIPNAVFTNLVDLADEGYADSHKFYVDGYIEIIELGSKVILVSGLGKGGKGYFALDLTAAAGNIAAVEANAANIVLWEYTDLTQAIYGNDLGYSFSRPWVGPSNDSGIDSLFVFGNGYDSANGHAVLFTVGLDSSGAIVWTKSIDTGIGGSSTNCNGLSSPAVLYPQGDGVDDYLYAGDLLGNMWKFDLTSSSNSSWDIYFSDGFNPQPLFIAKSNAGYRQPITMQPDVTTSCATGISGYLVTFGTGRLLDPDVDTYDLSVQTAYGIWDWSAAWEDEGVAPEGTYLGSFLPVSSPPTATCTSSCTSDLGDATTSGTCVYQCLGNSECIEECQQVYNSCTTNCSAIRNLSHMGTILGSTTSATYVALLRQTQVWGGGVNYNSDGSINEQQYGATNSANYDEITRIMSQNEIDWLLPSEKGAFVADTSKTVKHVGWYFDLPANGERIARDMTILNHKLIYTTSIPSDSPCESGGISNFFAVDVCTGGRVQTPFFDINGDGVIDSKDYINIGTTADPIYAAPSSIQVDDLAPAPTPVEVDNRPDRLYFPDKGGGPGGTGGTLIKGWGDALQYWRELEWK